MADHLYDLLSPHLPPTDAKLSQNPTTIQYLNRLPTLSLDALQTTECQSLTQSAHSNLLSLQALSNRSHKSFVTSADSLCNLSSSIPRLTRQVQELRKGVPKLDEEAVRFSSKYSRVAENTTLEQRKKVMRLSRNVDRISDILELPTLLATAVSSAAATSGNAGTSFSTTYSAALDLHAHIKRLQTLYPDSPLVRDVALQAEDAMREMASNLITALHAQNLRLAAAMRIVGWIRRVAPELDAIHGDGGVSAGGGALGALFLVCRLANLVSTLEALEPLRELADQETQRRTRSLDQKSGPGSWADGHQTEKYLKRYIEIFREQSFGIVSLYRGIFTQDQSDLGAAVPGIRGIDRRIKTAQSSPVDCTPDPFQCLPPALATFPAHLVQLITGTLRTYLPNIQDKTARESLLTQVLYCAASLGRLGGDFSMVLTELCDADDEDTEGFAYEWEEVMRKHRELAGRLEQLTGAGPTSPTGSSKGALQPTSPAAA
ncbi:Dor1-like family protein [Aspergillus lucknowensis]|uniref:Conserved oligomeric Golgi complex subunit 8 n=1 Tax=Aspergillus lucknowensis TaxID=176173 RepID=A0ABR4LUW8_9EURO